jgi:hypothetical protein
MASKASLIAKAFGGGGAFSQIADKTVTPSNRKLTAAAMATGATGMQTFANMAALIAHTGMVNGDLALVNDLNKIFAYTGTGWFLIATMTNATPTNITGVDGTYALAVDGTATTITAISTDPEGFPLTWSYAVTAGSLGSTATVAQADNVFTITPSTTEADAGTFSITFSVTDGATGAVSVVSAFTLAFASWATPTTALELTTMTNTWTTFSFSTDGNRMCIGGFPTAYDFRIYDRANSGTNHSLTTTITSTQYGANKATISANGLYVAAMHENNQYLEIWYYNGSSWTQQFNASITSYTNYAMRAAISGDGSTVMVVDHQSSTFGNRAGAIIVYKRTGTNWAYEAKFGPHSFVDNAQMGGDNTFSYFNSGISFDGNVIHSAYQYQARAGEHTIATRTGSTWTTRAAIYNSGTGLRGAISGDGNTFAYGNKIYVTTDNWVTNSLQATLTLNQTTEIRPHLSNDGNVAAFGQIGGGASSNGIVQFFRRSGSTWTLEGTYTGPASTQMGIDVRLSGDGLTAGVYGTGSGNLLKVLVQ